MTKIQEYLDKKKDFKDFLNKEGKNLFSSAAQEYFNHNPDALAIEFRAWTPGYNDGDPCIYRVSDVNAVHQEHVDKMKEELTNLDLDDLIQECLQNELCSCPFAYYESRIKEVSAHCQPMSILVLDSDLVYSVFGDAVKVTIFPNDGDAKIVVSDYECGY